MRSPRCAPLLLLLLLPPLLLTPRVGDAAVITGACDKDSQCGGGMCCAVSIWVKSIRICTPMGKLGDSCHPLTRKEMCLSVTQPCLELLGSSDPPTLASQSPEITDVSHHTRPTSHLQSTLLTHFHIV
uniref:prokineticin-2 isoform X2 n=1 Tax=Macaca mulatta TaxID=9544 RepID=UPI0007326DB4|nr:prokineticin-2 isoform X2 [Macaca mulatta]